MPLTGADVTQSFHSLWIKKHLERVKNKQLRHESSEVVMSLYIRICHFHVHLAIMFWMTFWLEGLPWDYGVSYTSQVATLYNLQPSNVTMNLVLWCLKVPKGSTQSHPHGTPLPLCRLRIGNLFWTLLIPKEPNGLNFQFFFCGKHRGILQHLGNLPGSHFLHILSELPNPIFSVLVDDGRTPWWFGPVESPQERTKFSLLNYLVNFHLTFDRDFI